MKILPPSHFTQVIEYTSERVLRLLGIRKPQRYSLKGSQLVESRYNFTPKFLRGGK